MTSPPRPTCGKCGGPIRRSGRWWVHVNLADWVDDQHDATLASDPEGDT